MKKLILLLLPTLAFGQLKILTADIPNGTVGSAYSTSFAASGGTAPYSWAVTAGTLPTGISLASNGTLSGTSSVVGWSGFFTVTVTDNVAATEALQYSFVLVPSLDTYGGMSSTSCSVTGFFHTVKVGTRWWQCTPLGHLMMMTGTAAVSSDPCTGTGSCVDATTGITDNYTTIATAHYGDASTQWACAQIVRMKRYGFNIVGQQSYAGLDPVSNSCNPKLPAVSQIQMIYAATNYNNYWGSGGAVKDIVPGVGPAYNGYRAASMDVFDPNLPVGFHTFADALTYPNTWNNAYVLGTLGDDIDWLYAFAAGPDFPTYPPGNVSYHIGWMTAITAPEQTYNAAARGTRQLYAQRAVYAKAAALDPGSCSIAAPCSWRDYVKKKYGTVGAMNAAWGSSYTSFDSTGTRVTDESIGTGDGMATTFNFTLAHPPSPLSLYIRKAGTNVGGDTPWWNTGGATNTGSLESPDNTLVSGSPCSLPALSFDTPGTGTWPAATYFYGCVYDPYTDGSFGIRGNFVSISLSAGQRPIVNSPATPPNATGYNVYGDCILASGSSPTWCHPAGTSTNSVVFRKQNSMSITIGNAFQQPNPLDDMGAVEPSIPGVLNYSTGVGSVTFSTAPTMGQAITIAYTWGGWKSGGTGLMDEDGTNTSIVGTNAYCATASALATNICKGMASPFDTPVANANAAWGADADAWIAHYSGKAHKIIRDEISVTNPDAAFYSFDTLGAWGVPPRKEVLQGAAPYSDVAYPAWAPPTQNGGSGIPNCCAQETYDYFDQYFGKPLFTATFVAATADSFLYPFYGNVGSDKGTQERKGQFYLDAITDLFNITATSSGSHDWIGAVGWGWLDFWTDGGGSTTRTNWGVISLNDNPYDGKSDCSVTRTAPEGFTTTAEANIPVWQANHAYAVDAGNGVYATIQPTSGTRYLFRQLAGSGTSSGSEPTWCTTTGCTTNDNGITWTNLGPKPSAVCFGNSIDYYKEANASWFGLDTSGAGGGGSSSGKVTITGTVVLQ